MKYDDESAPGFVHAWLLRSFVNGIICNIPYIGGLYSLIDILCIFGQDQRCVHDQIASTKVILAEPVRDRDDSYR